MLVAPVRSAEVVADLQRCLGLTRWPEDAGNQDWYDGVHRAYLTHGWPWTFWHWSKVIDPLADPGAHGGDPAEAFEVIVPSVPGSASPPRCPTTRTSTSGRSPTSGTAS